MNLRPIVVCALLAGAGLAPAWAVSPTGAEPLEFRGVIDTGASVTIGLSDPSTGENFWVPANGKGPGASQRVVVRSYDPAHGRLVVDYDGQIYSLTLEKAVIKAAPPPADAPGADVADANAGPDQMPATNPVPRRQSLRQVEVINQTLLRAGLDPIAP
jgi:hypothetical protein